MFYWLAWKNLTYLKWSLNEKDIGISLSSPHLKFMCQNISAIFDLTESTYKNMFFIFPHTFLKRTRKKQFVYINVIISSHNCQIMEYISFSYFYNQEGLILKFLKKMKFLTGIYIIYHILLFSMWNENYHKVNDDIICMKKFPSFELACSPLDHCFTYLHFLIYSRIKTYWQIKEY